MVPGHVTMVEPRGRSPKSGRSEAFSATKGVGCRRGPGGVAVVRADNFGEGTWRCHGRFARSGGVARWEHTHQARLVGPGTGSPCAVAGARPAVGAVCPDG